MSVQEIPSPPTRRQLAEQFFKPEYGQFIGGEWVAGHSGKTIEVSSPTDRSRLALIAAGDAVDVQRAVKAASDAFVGWSRSHAMERQAILGEMARRLSARVEDYAMMETLDNGKPIRDSAGFDLPGAAAVYGYYATTPLHIKGEAMDFPGVISLIHREPLGVCAAIVPWNIPMYCTALKIGPALATGNTVVLKPAESTCLSILEFFAECADIIPPGVVNIVTGYGPEAGEPLITHPDVRKVSFTGSRPTASKILQYASVNIIPQTMELGGKSANIICADADLDAAVEGVVMSTVFNKGEVCIAGTRTFVHNAVMDEFLDKLRQTLNVVAQGDPTLPTTQIGPQASEIQFDKVKSYLELGPTEGATVFAGGRPATVDGLKDGLFIEPTVFTGVTNDMRIAQEEIFGPVTCVQGWTDDDEVLRLANETQYGLGGGVWTRDITRAHRFAREMQTGTIWINRFFNFQPGAPLGGYKGSGFGRENSFETLLHYTQAKSVIVNLEEGPIGLYGQPQAAGTTTAEDKSGAGDIG